MIRIDNQWFDMVAIDTDEWLEKVSDMEVTEIVDDAYDYVANHGDDLDDRPHWGNEYDADAIAGIASTHFGITFAESKMRDNVYNSENDFTDQFVFEVFASEDADEWYYSKCLIAVNVHLGGDVRGNYGGCRWFVVECPAECGFLDWCVNVDPCYANGERADDEGKYSVGYQSAPLHGFNTDAKVVGYSEKRGAWLAWLDHRAVEVHFSCNAEYH